MNSFFNDSEFAVIIITTNNNITPLVRFKNLVRFSFRNDTAVDSLTSNLQVWELVIESNHDVNKIVIVHIYKRENYCHRMYTK